MAGLLVEESKHRIVASIICHFRPICVLMGLEQAKMAHRPHMSIVVFRPNKQHGNVAPIFKFIPTNFQTLIR
jgi:hypothetical protein